jgi:hypothetical protein
MRQLVTSQLLAFHRHRRKAAAVLALKILAVAALVAVLSLQLTAILQQDQGSPPTLGWYTYYNVPSLFFLFFCLLIVTSLFLDLNEFLACIADGKCN